MRKTFLFLLLNVLALPLFARTLTYTYLGQTLSYNVLDEQNKTCEVGKNYSLSSKTLTIPSKVRDSYTSEEYTVVGICAGALEGYKGTSVTLPSTVTYIGASAFESCSSLTQVNIPTITQSIGDEAFSNCSNLSNLSISEFPNLKTIGKMAFYFCRKLEGQLSFPALTEIGECAFYYCESLPSVTIDSNLEVIPNNAFAFCRNLTSLVLPTNLKEIGEYAFDTCEAMTEVTLPNSLKKIGYCGFLYCSKLESIAIPENCVELGETIFQHCSNLRNVLLPSTLKKLPNYIFNGCNQLKTINIPASVDSIGRKAFGNAVRLESISIPKSVTYIGPEAFFNCPNLSALNIYADAFLTIEESVFGVSTYGPTDGIYPKDIRPTAILKVPSNWYNKYKSDPIWGKFTHIEPLTYPIIESFSLSESKLTMIEGDFGSVKAIDNNAEIIVNGLYWSSDNECVATVDTKGIIKAVAPGEAVITCKWITPSGSKFLQSLSIEVKDFVLKIKLPNGYTELLGAAHNTYKFRFSCEDGFNLHQAFIDDEDITSLISTSPDFVYEVKPARKDRVLYAIFRSDVNTGIDITDVANTSNIKFTITEHQICIEGAKLGSEVRLYDISGCMLKSTTNHSFDVEYRGIIILTVDGQIFKFIM